MILYPYSNASASAKALKYALGIKMIKKKGSKFKGGPLKTVINWGNSRSTPEVDKCCILNYPGAVSICVDKLKFYNTVPEFVPPYCTEREVAEVLVKDGDCLVARTVLNGHSGEGIVIINSPEEMVDAPLYVRYVKKEQEYRVHIFHGEVFFVQRKARVKEIPDDQINWKVRNLAGGFIYQQNDFHVPDVVLTDALNCVYKSGLDFGAVDVIYHQKYGTYVLEINTAPGLAGTTLQKYVEQFEKYYG